MRIESKKSKATVTLLLDEDEAVMLYQLTGNVAGTGARSKFYATVCHEVMAALRKVGVDLPPGYVHFAVVDGKYTALDEAKSTMTPVNR